MASTLDGLIANLTTTNQWKRGGERAPHKPLLLLLYLARIQRGEARLWRYAELEPKLTRLLKDYGPPRKSFHPEQPFWRLQNDGDFWQVPERTVLLDAISDRAKQGSVPPGILRDHDAQGGFCEHAFDLLKANPMALNQLAAQLLVDNFPESMHEEILDAVGMPWIPETGRQRRDPAFRADVLRIYEYRCAVCGYDGRLGNTTLGLEAAHIKWHAAGGPDVRENGVALCTFHHKAIDRGAIGLSDDLHILISQEVNGNPIVTDWLIRYAGRPLRPPQVGEPPPNVEFIAWHRREVFHEPARANPPTP
jgi:putative restriction endonuclease